MMGFALGWHVTQRDIKIIHAPALTEADIPKGPIEAADEVQDADEQREGLVQEEVYVRIYDDGSLHVEPANSVFRNAWIDDPDSTYIPYGPGEGMRKALEEACAKAARAYKRWADSEAEDAQHRAESCELLKSITNE